MRRARVLALPPPFRESEQERSAMNESSLVQKVCNYATVLRNEGVHYGAYISQISFLLFLKMDEEAEFFGGAAITNAGFALDSLAARHADTLAPVACPTDGPLRLLVAARIGGTRLSDNVGV
jgi:hypothetical protein